MFSKFSKFSKFSQVIIIVFVIFVTRVVVGLVISGIFGSDDSDESQQVFVDVSAQDEQVEKGLQKYKDLETYKALSKYGRLDGFTLYYKTAIGTACLEQKSYISAENTLIEKTYVYEYANGVISTQKYKTITKAETENFYEYTYNYNQKTYEKILSADRTLTTNSVLVAFFWELEHTGTRTDTYNGKTYTVDSFKDVRTNETIEAYVSDDGVVEYIRNDLSIMNEFKIITSIPDDAFDLPDDFVDEATNPAPIYTIDEKFKSLASYKALEKIDASNGFSVCYSLENSSASFSSTIICKDRKYLHQVKTYILSSQKTTEEFTLYKDKYTYISLDDSKTYTKAYIADDREGLAYSPAHFFFKTSTYETTTTEKISKETYTVDQINTGNGVIKLYVNSQNELKYVRLSDNILYNVEIKTDIDSSVFDIPAGYTEAK